jgi:segregation and condensation protein B
VRSRIARIAFLTALAAASAVAFATHASALALLLAALALLAGAATWLDGGPQSSKELTVIATLAAAAAAGRVLLAPVPDVQPVTVIVELCERLAAAYDDAGHGFQLVRIAGGYRYQTHPRYAAYVEKFVLDGQRARMSSAALETLAIVAYKQPISRAQVAAIRGVDPDGVLRTLQARGYVDQVGHDPGPGQATLWGTTSMFLEKLGLDSVADLPPLAQFVPGADVVEALENGLRITPVVDVAPPARTPSPTSPHDPSGRQTDPAPQDGSAGPHAGAAGPFDE